MLTPCDLLRFSEAQQEGSRPPCAPAALAEQVAFLAHVKHANIVPFVGSCDAIHEQILVFEFIPNGSLSQWLRPTDGETRPLEASQPKPGEAAVHVRECPLSCQDFCSRCGVSV